MPRIHPNARTTPAVRAEIARSGEATGVLARRFGVSTETVRKWRKRGPGDCLDHSARPHRLPWKATDEERAVVCALRRATDFALDDLTFVVAHFLPRLNRDSVWRILRAEGLGRRPPPSSDRPKRGQGTFRDCDLGFVHIDIEHLPEPQTGDGERRKRHLFVAIDRRSRSVHLAVKDDETEKSAVAFLREAAAAFPFRLTHVLTDNGSCFTPAFARACAELGAEYRHTRPYSPHTNGMVERFNGRVGGEVLGITIRPHRQLERLLRGFNAAYNARRQRVLDGRTPDQVVAERLKARRKLANPTPHGRAGPEDIAQARLIAEAAKDVSPPDNYPTVGVAEARARAAEAKRLARAGVDSSEEMRSAERRARGGPTVADLFGRYAAEHLRRNGLRSAGNAEKQLRLHVLPAWGKRPVAGIERGDLVRLIEAVRVPRTHEVHEGDRILRRVRGGPGAAAEVRKWCRAMFQFAVDAGLRADNPFADVRNRDRQRPRDRVLSMAELRAVWEAAGDLGYPWGPWYRLILLTGDRRGEWARARWDWLDAERTRLEIPASEYKTGKAQVVPLSSQARAILAALPPAGLAGPFLFSSDGRARPVSGFSKAKARLDRAIAQRLGHALPPRKLGAADVIDVLSDLFVLRGVPGHVRSDNVLCREAAGRVRPQVSVASLR